MPPVFWLRTRRVHSIVGQPYQAYSLELQLFVAKLNHLPLDLYYYYLNYIHGNLIASRRISDY